MYKITLGIDGMACGMCESHINDVIRKNFTVKKVSSSANKKMSEIIAEEQIDREKLKAEIDKTGYKMISYKCEPYEKKAKFLGIFG